MPVYKLTAPRNMGKIPKGFCIQVPSQMVSKPNAHEIEKAIIQAGFTDRDSIGYRSPGNWIVEKIA